MDKLNFTEVNKEQQERKAQYPVSDKPKNMRPGLHGVTITGVTGSPDDIVGSPYVIIGFVNENNEVFNAKFFMSPAAQKWSLIKIKNVIDSAEVLAPDEITVDALNQMLTGKQMILKISGEEVRINDQQTGQMKTIVRPVAEDFKFTCSMAKAGSLTFDPAVDIERLSNDGEENSEAATSDAPKESAGDDLPF